MPPEPNAGARAALGGLHATFIALLIALRPLVWDEDAVGMSGVASIGYLALVAVALLVVIAESWGGERRAWRWGPAGLAFGVLVVALIPAMLRSPLPDEGAALWLMLASQLGLAAYLAQVVPGRERVAFAALGAGLVGESLIAVLQWPWVLPTMIREQQQGALAVPPELRGDLGERLANGGIFGTFTTANGLAAYLLLAAVPLVVSSWRGGSAAPRILAALAGALALAAFIGTKSKGAYLALGLAIAVAWWCGRRGLARWLPAAAVAVLAIAALVVPSVRQGMAASAQVRLGYWEGALSLVREHPLAGSGLRSFGEEIPRALPVWAEFSIHAHDEPLELAVEAGVPLGLLGLVVLALLLRRPASPPATTSPESETPRLRWLPLALAAGLIYFSMLGMLDENTSRWPGGRELAGSIAWTAIFAAVMAGAFAVFQRLAVPGPTVFLVALGALTAHSLIDFDLHSGAIVGTVVVCAVLATSHWRSWSVPKPALAIGTISVAAYVALVLAAAFEASSLRAARDIVENIGALQNPALMDERPRRLQTLAELSGAPIAAPPDQPQVARAIVIDAFKAADRMAERDYQLRTQLMGLMPPDRERAPYTSRLAEQRRLSAAAQGYSAQDARAWALAAERAGDAAMAAARWNDALAAMRRARDLGPQMLHARVFLVTLLEEAAQHLPQQAAALHAEAEAEKKAIADLQAQVNPRYRL